MLLSHRLRWRCLRVRVVSHFVHHGKIEVTLLAARGGQHLVEAPGVGEIVVTVAVVVVPFLGSFQAEIQGVIQMRPQVMSAAPIRVRNDHRYRSADLGGP